MLTWNLIYGLLEGKCRKQTFDQGNNNPQRIRSIGNYGEMPYWQQTPGMT
jgi:hypothetical protein